MNKVNTSDIQVGDRYRFIRVLPDEFTVEVTEVGDRVMGVVVDRKGKDMHGLVTGGGWDMREHPEEWERLPRKSEQMNDFYERIK